jgi:hypothetical protein
MKRFLPWAILGLLWAVLAPPIYFWQDIGDEQARALRAVSSSLDHFALGTTNEIVAVPTVVVTSVAKGMQDLSRKENSRAERFRRAMWCSSGVIVFTVVFALYCLRRSGKT